MPESFVRVEREGHVRRVIMDRPDKLNALGPAICGFWQLLKEQPVPVCWIVPVEHRPTGSAAPGQAAHCADAAREDSPARRRRIAADAERDFEPMARLLRSVTRPPVKQLDHLYSLIVLNVCQ